jgi:hypothetical protein
MQLTFGAQYVILLVAFRPTFDEIQNKIFYGSYSFSL